jgi:hypothetical protein
MKTVVPALLSLLLACVLVDAQETADAGTGSPRRMLIAVGQDAGGALTPGDLLQLSRSFQMQLQKATADVDVVEPPESLPNLSPTVLDAAARAAGADSWLSVNASGGWAALRLAARSSDLLTNAIVLDTAVTRSGWGSSQDLAVEEWAEIVQPIAGHYHRFAAVAATGTHGPMLATVTVRALPGTRITGLGEPALIVDQSGTASREMPAARQYELGAILRGYIYSRTSIFLSADRVVSLPQKPESVWSLDASLEDRAYPGVSLGWSPDPGRTTFRLGIQTYLFGLAFDSSEAVSSAPLSNIFLLAEVSPRTELGLLRSYLALEVFLRIDHPSGSTPWIDVLSPGGVKTIFGLELRTSPGGGFFLEYVPTLYFTQVPDYFEAALGAGSLPPGWFFGTSSALNLLSFRAGYRWQL